jgi:hypothetical protein
MNYSTNGDTEMEDNLFILTMRIEQACGSHCKATEVEDLIEEVAEAEATYMDQHRNAEFQTREWRRAYFVREHLAKYKARLKDRLRELEQIEKQRAEHQAFQDSRAEADYAMRQEISRRDWSKPLNHGAPAYPKEA